MQSMNWSEKALYSEIEFSKALKSQPTPYPHFIHLYNPHVQWGGDFNRAVGVQITDFQLFDEIVIRVEQIHLEKRLERPDRFDALPPALEERQWREYLRSRGYHLLTAIFLHTPTKEADLLPGYTLYRPSTAEYLAWYTGLAEAQGYAEADWFQQNLPLKVNFTQVFWPYWLMRGEEQIGWVYAAHMGDFTRLFEVEIKPEYQGQGMGKLLMQAITAEGYRQGTPHILLQSDEKLRPFYEKCGFRECTRNSIIRRIT